MLCFTIQDGGRQRYNGASKRIGVSPSCSLKNALRATRLAAGDAPGLRNLNGSQVRQGTEVRRSMCLDRGIGGVGH